jgi:crotonobetainyl-CoA:carnitine CoA-transferase CaiB-like acyl-CoA transferase
MCVHCIQCRAKTWRRHLLTVCSRASPSMMRMLSLSAVTRPLTDAGADTAAVWEASTVSCSCSKMSISSNQPHLTRAVCTASMCNRIIVMMPFREDYYWPRFCKALGKPEWTAAEEYATPALRGEQAVPPILLSAFVNCVFSPLLRCAAGRHRKALGNAIQEIFRTNTMANWLQILEENGCIAVSLLSASCCCACSCARTRPLASSTTTGCF